VPDTASASCIDSIDGYFPVPRNNREVKRCGPMISGWSTSVTAPIVRERAARHKGGAALAVASAHHERDAAAVPSHPDYRLRRATARDEDMFTAQRLDIFREVHGLQPAHDDLERRTRAAYAALVADPAMSTWLALDEHGRAVGSAACHTFNRLPSPANPAGREAYVSHVYVAPAWRRRGVGKALVSAIADEMRALGLSRVRLHATPDGLQLYETLGFRRRENDMELRL
jgi:ribosomal protein S18 acetylase RimI-like enzyme